MLEDNSENVDKTSDLSTTLFNLLEALSEQGYPLAQIDSIVHTSNSVDIFLTEGPEAKGVQQFTDPRFKPNPELEQKINQEAILRNVNSTLTTLTNAGYPFASVVIFPEEIQKLGDSLFMNIRYSVNEGQYARINKLSFPGQLFPNSNLLNLESRIQRGGAFSAEELDRGLQRLKRLDNILSLGEVSLRSSSPGIVDIIIPVEERSINRFSGIATINPDDGTPYGEANISFGNIFGTGRKLEFSWSGLQKGQQGIHAKYREPWLFSYPLHIDIGMNRKTEDSLETFTSYQLGINWEPDMHLTIGGNLEQETIVLRRAGEQNDEQIKTTWMGASLTVNYLDHDWNPTKGFRLESTTSAGFRNPGGDSSSETVHREDFNLRFALPVKSSFVAYFKGETKHITANNPNSTEMIRIGGINSVRGYSEERYRALRVSWMNTEFRWRQNVTSYYGVFADFGFIHQSSTRYLVQDKYFSSVGISSEFISRAGHIGFALGLGAGNPIQQSRLHFRIQTLF